MFKLDMLNKETERLHELLRLIKANKTKEDKVWDNFCKEMNKNKEPKKYFQKHPKHLSNSSSEILSPRQNDHQAKKDVNRAKSTNSIRFARSANDTYDVEDEAPEISDASVEVVTIREEYPSKKNLRIDEASVCNRRNNKLPDKKATKSKDNIKYRKVNEKSSLDAVAKKKSSKELKNSTSSAVKTDVYHDLYKDNFQVKLHNIIEKSLTCMEDIRIQLDVGLTQPDGLDDFERRKRRSTEFAARFSRNYLYQLNRQISDITKLLKPGSARSNNQNDLIIKQKLTASYQTVLQGLQAYLTHLPVSTAIAVPEKIKELLKEVATLCEIQRSYANTDLNSNVKDDEIIDVFLVRSRCLSEKIDECYSASSVISLFQSGSKYSLLEASKAKKKNNSKTRYSMYNGPSARREAYWKRAVAALAKKKYNVPSKYKTAHFKHRPPVEKPSSTKPVVKPRPLERRSSTSIRPKTVIDDENIRTMMEIEREKDQHVNPKESNQSFARTEDNVSLRSETLVPLVERLIEKLKANNKEMTQEHVRCVLQGIANDANQTGSDDAIADLANRLLSQRTQRKESPPDEDLVEKLVEVIKNHSRVIAGDREVEDEVQVDAKAGKKKKERKKTVTVTGTRNAQLICIRDEDSLIETSPDELVKEHGVPVGQNVPQTKSQLQVHGEATEMRNKDVNFQQPNVQQSHSNETVTKLNFTERTSKIKISRLPKVSLQPLKMLPKKFALNILEYKINYLKARKNNHMYRKSCVKQPWILMGEISDKILDELLQAIGSEIEVNDVIEGIYASEFI